jgi:hypothetical protein
MTTLLTEHTNFTSRFRRHFVDRIEERDVDLMLLEEVACERGFQEFVAMRMLELDRDWTFLEAANSISTVSHGESDLLVVYANGSRVAAVLIENKITANFMPEQADRYRRRGEEGIRDGHWTEYVTALVAPRRYLTADLSGHIFDRHLAYEDLLPWFERTEGGARGAWRAALLRRACGGSKSTIYRRVVDEPTTRFFHDYWAIASSQFPDLRMKRDKDRPAGSTWVQFHPDIGLPAHISLHHKAAETFAADLSFSRTSVENLHAAAAHLLEPDMFVEQRRKSAVIRIQTTPLSVSAGCAAQEQAVRDGLEAARRLARFFVKNREVLAGVPHR